ncbi:paraquat-inducible protein A [Azospirillum picis]|uniref:Paraquat-inducible protein A n=1 Tax=Azospirillum picis TaxID=488438 RepID=A0ABU0MMM4_9PROT|nr:paraquat-inducible protein A [Azospirillum picis]MBP2300959.1 paraquat-inducible protein A [Azospirillum picis]MDQ0534421.1 paraquat-inducible protein A [Azospirillum picis]
MSAGFGKVELRDIRAVARDDLIGCPHCGRLHRIRLPAPGRRAECSRCGAVLFRRGRGGLHHALPMAITGALLLLLVAANPLMAVHIQGNDRTSLVTTGIEALAGQGMWPLSLLVGLLVLAAPFARVMAVIAVLLRVHRGRRPGRPRETARLFAWTETLRPWAMLDVFLLGLLVGYSRLKGFANAEVLAGGIALGGYVVARTAMDLMLDHRAVWQAIDHVPATDEPPPARWVSCGVCHRIHGCDHGPAPERCTRCHSRLHAREPESLERTTALVAAGIILYIPANLLPVMTVVNFGQGAPSTILSGVHELAEVGLWPLALLVFVASVAVPVLKLAGLGWFILSARRGSPSLLHARTRLYRIIDAIGRWSNIDVFMIAILTALVQFGAVASVRADPGAVAFAAVVILTMMASHVFDPRVMWDRAEENPRLPAIPDRHPGRPN